MPITCMMGVAPEASRGSACKVERKVSEPSKPRPDRKAPITGITDSSRSSQRTRPCRCCSLNALRKKHHSVWLTFFISTNKVLKGQLSWYSGGLNCLLLLFFFYMSTIQMYVGHFLKSECESLPLFVHVVGKVIKYHYYCYFCNYYYSN